MADFELQYGPQDPAGIADYPLSFSADLFARAPLTFTALHWAIAAIAGDAAPLVIVAQTNAPDFSSTVVRVSGGTLGLNYSVRCTRTWSDGEIDVVSFTLPIAYT